MKKLLIFIILGLYLGNSYCDAKDNFPIDSYMRVRVDFWIQVYTETSDKEWIVHDSRNLGIIYKKIKIKSKNKRNRKKEIKKHITNIKKILLSIARKKKKNINKNEMKIYQKVKKISTSDIYKMASRIRLQQGMKEKFKHGLIASNLYLPHIKNIFKKYNLPMELSYLPHVESSFNYRAYSKVGAAGIWQFMRSTARQYKLKLNYLTDERRDPIKATDAAARLLKDNFRRLKSWPLSVTAYNHGPTGVFRASKKVKSRNMSTIIKYYDGKRFGFASRNFYPSFMAAVEVAKKPTKFFNNIKFKKSISFNSIKLSSSISVRNLLSILKLNKKVLKEYNLGLRKTVFKNNLSLKKGMVVHIPKTPLKKITKIKQSLLERGSSRLKKLKTIKHKVIKGDNLYHIASRYGVSLGDLFEFNHISNPSKIFPGKIIKIPYEQKDTEKNIENILPMIAEKSVVINEIDFNYLEFINAYNFELQELDGRFYLITVEVDETLGHLADWTGYKTSYIRQINNLKFGQNIYLGEKLKLKIDKNNLYRFNIKRIQYHQTIEEDFVGSYQIVDKTSYKVKRGDSLVSISNKFDIPIWLLRKSLKNKLRFSLKMNENIQIPVVDEVNL